MTYEEYRVYRIMKQYQHIYAIKYKKKLSSLKKRIKIFKKSITDFDETIESVDNVEISYCLQDLLLSSNLGPQIMYELAKNPGELNRISRLNPEIMEQEFLDIEMWVKLLKI